MVFNDSWISPTNDWESIKINETPFSYKSTRGYLTWQRLYLTQKKMKWIVIAANLDIIWSRRDTWSHVQERTYNGRCQDCHWWSLMRPPTDREITIRLFLKKGKWLKIWNRYPVYGAASWYLTNLLEIFDRIFPLLEFLWRIFFVKLGEKWRFVFT